MVLSTKVIFSSANVLVLTDDCDQVKRDDDVAIEGVQLTTYFAFLETNLCSEMRIDVLNLSLIGPFNMSHQAYAGTLNEN